MSGAWRALLRDRATVKRGETTVSDTGASATAYTTVVASGVPCSIQDAGGRMRQDDFGQRGERTVRLVFGPEVDVAQNDLVVDERTLRSYKVMHMQMTSNGHHLKGTATQWVMDGGD